MGSAHERNRRAWNRLADDRSQFTRTATDEECLDPLRTLDSRGWLPDSVHGWKVLCLASGGGWQAILYAAAGAEVTVVDISESMLQLDRVEAQRRGYHVNTIQTSMDDLRGLPDAGFDLVHQPVSTCYIPDLDRVYSEIGRVLRPGGLYISQHKVPTSLQITHRNAGDHFVLGIEYYHEGPLPPTRDTSYRETGAVEFLHRWEELIGGLCRQGFVVEDLVEPKRADPTAPVHHFRYRGRFVAPYVRIKARRLPTPPRQVRTIWTPST